MPRNLSAGAKAALFANESGQAAIQLITISHALLAVPIRLARNTENIISNGNTFVPFAFDITPPAEEEDRLTGSKLAIDNTDRTILTALGGLDSAPTVTLEVVASDTPDEHLGGPWDFTWRVTTYNPRTIVGDLQFEDLLNAVYPKDAFTPSYFDGMF